MMGSAYLTRRGAVGDLNASVLDSNSATLTFSQKQRRAAVENVGVEDCPLPAVPSARELLMVPHKLSLDSIAIAAVGRQAERFSTPVAQEAWKVWAFQTVTRELLLNAFWWFFADIFKAGARGSQALKTALFGRIAQHYMTVVYPTDGSRPNDRNLEAFGTCLAEAISLCFHTAFPRSAPSFGASFHRRVEQQIMEWTRGVPRRDLLANGTKHDAAHGSRPGWDKDRDKEKDHHASEDEEEGNATGAVGVACGGGVGASARGVEADAPAGAGAAPDGLHAHEGAAGGKECAASPKASAAGALQPPPLELRWAVPVADALPPHGPLPSSRPHGDRGGLSARTSVGGRAPASVTGGAGRGHDNASARGAPAETSFTARRPASSSGTRADAGGNVGEHPPALTAAARWAMEYGVTQPTGRPTSGRTLSVCAAAAEGGWLSPRGQRNGKAGSGGGPPVSHDPRMEAPIGAPVADHADGPPLPSARASSSKGGGGRQGSGVANGGSTSGPGGSTQGGWVITSLSQPLSGGASALPRPLSSSGVRDGVAAGGTRAQVATASAKGSLTARCWTAGDAAPQASQSAPSPAAPSTAPRPATSSAAMRAAISGATPSTSRPSGGFQLSGNSTFVEQVMSSYGLAPQRVKSGRLQRHMSVGERDRSNEDSDEDEEEESYRSFARGPMGRIRDAQAAYERQRVSSAAVRREARRQLAGTRVHMDTVRASVLQSDPRHFSNWISGWTDKDEDAGEGGTSVGVGAGGVGGAGGAAGARRSKGDAPAVADVKSSRRKTRRHESEKPARAVKRDKDSRDLLAKMTVRAMAAQSGNDADAHWHESLRAKMHKA